MERAVRRGKRLKPKTPDVEMITPFPLTVNIVKTPGGEHAGELHAELSPGRPLWLWEIEHAVRVTGANIAAAGLRWSVAEPRPGSEWFTSDHPFVRVNYYGNGKYDFGGGWGYRGSELLLPLSPRALLYSKVGTPFPFRFTPDPAAFITMRWLIARRAFHSIYATKPQGIVQSFRQRTVDVSQFNTYRDTMDRWHERELAAEQGPSDQPPEADPRND